MVIPSEAHGQLRLTPAAFAEILSSVELDRIACSDFAMTIPGLQYYTSNKEVYCGVGLRSPSS